MSLKEKAVSGVKWTSISAVVASGFQLLQIAILARFLDKDDFGLMAMAIFVIGISRIFIDMGISNALVHKQRVNKYQLSTLFWLNIFLGIVIFLLVVVLSPFISTFYKTPELSSVINWVAVSFLILPLGQQFDALLKRDMKFKPLAIRDILSKLAGFIVSIFLAYWGHGVYALVFGNLAGAILAAGLLLFLGLRDYRPQFIFSLRSLKNQGFYSFGFFQMGEKLINYFNSNFDTILIGKILGMEALGLYNIAKTLAMKPYQVINPIITKVAFPAFARVQDDIERLKRAYLKVIEMLTNVNVLSYGLMIVLADPLIQIVFGSEWTDATVVFQLLAVGALCNSIGNPVGSLQLAKGRADWGFYWNLGLFLVMPFVIWYGSLYGVLGITLALAIFKIITAFFISWKLFIKPLSHATYREYTWSFLKPILLAILSSILPLLFLYLELTANKYSQFIVGGLLYCLTYFTLSYIFSKSTISEVAEIINLKLINK